jgi:hypothetical protein
VLLDLFCIQGRVVLGKVERAAFFSDYEDALEEGVMRNFAGSQIGNPCYFRQVVEDGGIAFLGTNLFPNPAHLLNDALASPLLMDEDERFGLCGLGGPYDIDQVVDREVYFEPCLLQEAHSQLS